MRPTRTSALRTIPALLLSLLLILSALFPGAARSSAPFAIDGRIAFANSGQIFLINADGTGLVQLTNNPNVYHYQPALSPDGTRVAFSAYQPNLSEIQVVNSDGSNLRSLTSNTISHDSEPAWSPDGTQIAFVRGFDPTSIGIANFTSCGFEIYSVNVDGKPTERRLTDGYGGTDPAWSPDGTQIAFTSSRGDNLDIYALTVQTGEIKQLTETAEHEAEPAWSPDGSQIAYARGYVPEFFACGFAHTGLGNPPYVTGSDIYVMAADGKNQARLTETENNFDPTWSPNGTALAFISFRDGTTQVYVRDQTEKNEYAITSTGGEKTSPSWSH